MAGIPHRAHRSRITVFAVKAGAVVGVGSAMAGASMLRQHGRADPRSPEVIEAADQENWNDFKRRMSEVPPPQED
jgi:hypothetical protein